MELETYLAFVAAAALVIASPGPSMLLIVARAMRFGARHSLVTIAGVAASHSMFFAVAAFGVTTLLGTLASWFVVLKYLGAAWLIALGVRQWRADPAIELDVDAEPAGNRLAAFLQGFLVTTTNPKALVFFAVFFPPFVNVDARWAPQLLVMGTTFVALLIAISFAFASLAARTRSLFGDARRVRVRNRVTGSLIAGAGVGLAASSR